MYYVNNRDFNFFCNKYWKKIGQFVKTKKLRILENKAALIIMKTVKHTKFYN